MVSTDLLLAAVVAGLTIRAFWLSAVQRRHIGWVPVGCLAAALVLSETVAADWLAVTCWIAYAVSEFVIFGVFAFTRDTHRGPAGWVLRHLPPSGRGRHCLRRSDEPELETDGSG